MTWTRTTLAVTALVALSSVFPVSPLALGDDDVAFAAGSRNPNAVAPLARLDYLIGRWELTSYSRDEDGKFQPAPGKTWFEARYSRDGHGIVTEYHSGDPDAFYSLTVIGWDAATESFAVSFHNLKRSRRIRFDGRWTGETLEITNRGGYGGTEDFLFRETDLKIAADSFEKRLHRSDDGGATWTELDYYFSYRRAP